MKRKIFTLALSAFMIVAVSTLFAADKKIVPTKVKNLKGKVVNTKTFNNDGEPFVLMFWATWCKPCVTELTAIADLYEDWQDETGIKIIAVSIDDSRNAKKVPAFVRGRGWDYEVYIDENSDFRRAMSVNNPPHTFLVDGKGKIVWEHNGYAPGDEEELYEQIRQITK